MYSFQENMDDFTPSGEYEYFFHRVDDEDETKVVEADSSQEAYRHLHNDVGNQWKEWICVGRKDILEYKVEEHEKYETLREARCSTTGLYPTDFGSRNKKTVERWEDEDE